MSAPEPSDGAGSSFGASLATHLGVVVGLIVLVALAFWAIGNTGDDDGLIVADAPTDDEPSDPVEPTDEEPDEPGDDVPADDPPPTDEAPDPELDDEPTDPAADHGDEDPADDPADDDPADDDPPADDTEDAEDAEDTEEPDVPAISPSDITVQVLDGYQADGGAAAGSLAEQLRTAGYTIVAENPALRYDVTTVLWTTGNEAAARQVAAEIGAAEVRAQPGSLSESVAVHVVVGADRG